MTVYGITTREKLINISIYWIMCSYNEFRYTFFITKNTERDV